MGGGPAACAAIANYFWRPVTLPRQRLMQHYSIQPGNAVSTKRRKGEYVIERGAFIQTWRLDQKNFRELSETVLTHLEIIGDTLSILISYHVTFRTISALSYTFWGYI